MPGFSVLHSKTPTLVGIDPLGATVRKVAYWRRLFGDTCEARVTRQHRDAQARIVAQWDPRLWSSCQADLANQRNIYGVGDGLLATTSVDSGWRINLANAAGLPALSWDGRGKKVRVEYDNQLRPVAIFEHAHNHGEVCAERFGYADASLGAAERNQCGRLVRNDDGAGTWHGNQMAMNGAVLQQTRRFTTGAGVQNWPAALQERDALLEPGAPAVASVVVDALGNHLSQTDAKGNRQRYTYSVDGAVGGAWLQLQEGAEQQLLSALRYTASGQFEQETAGNGVVTTAMYSPAEARLERLLTCKGDGVRLQDLNYQYDPVGNVTETRDDAQAVQHFNNQRTEAVRTYTYDTLYQLTLATGRECAMAPPSPGLPELQPFPADPGKFVNFTRTYEYDAACNMTQLRHVGAHSYSREMLVAHDSNRSVPKDGVALDLAFDANGNLQQFAPGQRLVWDARNRLSQVTAVVRSGGDDDRELYAYDGAGQRVRKLHYTLARTTVHCAEVRYLPGLELHTNSARGEALQVISVAAGYSMIRVLHWEAGRPEEIENGQVRYSVSDYLGSSCLELDGQARLLSLEGYYPFGGTAYWAARNVVEAKYKVLRYSGKERDISGLYYYGARYYAPWLNRWISPDPAGDVDGLNLFSFVKNRPMTLMDATGMTGGSNPKFLENYNRDWLPQMESGRLSADTTRIAKFSIAIVDTLRERTGASLRVGGSLAAAMFGGSRTPVDIDIEVPIETGGASAAGTQMEQVKSRFMKMAGVSLTLGLDLFHIKSLAKGRGGVEVEFQHILLDQPLDVLDDDDEIESLVENTRSKTYKVDVDFSSEHIYPMSQVKVDADDASDIGYYRPPFLMAAYANRLAVTEVEGAQDLKNDRGQITDLMTFLVRQGSGGTGDSPQSIADSVVTRYIELSNPRRETIVNLFRSISTETARRLRA